MSCFGCENKNGRHFTCFKSKNLGPARGRSHVACLNFKTSRVGVYKCLSLIVGFAVTVAIWPREVVSCRDFILRTVATFWAMSLVGIYPGRASELGEIIAKNMAKKQEHNLKGNICYLENICRAEQL